MAKKIEGIVACPITPFYRENGSVDLPTLKALLDQLIADGAHAIAPLGSTGESAYLENDEWDAVAETSVKHVNGRVPVIVGISDLTTKSAVRRAKVAAKVGADAVMVLPISYWKLSEKEIFQHYVSIAEAVDLPIMVYNNPATSGIDLKPEFIVQLVNEIENVTMVKESTGDIQRMHAIHKLSDGAIPFYNGSNPLALEAFAAGATGWCTAAPNLYPAGPQELYRASQAGDLNKAREVFYQQLPLLEFILRSGLPTTIKAGLRLLGLETGNPRKPLQPLDANGTKELEGILKGLSRL